MRNTSERVLNISDQQIDFLRLVQRSPNAGDGWRKVGATLRKLVQSNVDERPELYETKVDDCDQLFIRLSERGALLTEYVGKPL